MSLREEAFREIERTPESLLPEVIDFVKFVRERRKGASVDPRSIEERLAALDAWAGHLDLPALPDEAFDRDTIYRDVV